MLKTFSKMEIVRACQLCEASREKEDSIQIFYRKKGTDKNKTKEEQLYNKIQ